MPAPTLPIAIAVGLALTTGAAASRDGPPRSSYSLSDVTITYFAASAQIAVTGDGTVFRYERSGFCAVSHRQPDVTPEAVLTMLQMCYDGQVFDLPNAGLPSRFIRLTDDGKVESTLIVSRGPEQALQVCIAGFCKIVSVDDDGTPAVLRELAVRLDALGNRDH